MKSQQATLSNTNSRRDSEQRRALDEQPPKERTLTGPAREKARQLADILRMRIQTGEWPPGHTFSHAQLAEEFSLAMHQTPHVSVPAVVTLRQEGLLESRPRVGIRVCIKGKSWSPEGDQPNLPHDMHIEMVLKHQLHKGFYKPGDRFPSIRALADEFKVSDATVRKALRAMQEQGLLKLRNANTRIVSPSVAEMPPENLLRPPVRRKPGRAKLLAFGEQRSLAEWVRDPRCLVDHRVLYTRYFYGWDLELAIQTPKTIRARRNANDVPKSPNGRALTGRDKATGLKNTIRTGAADGTYPPGHVISSVDLSLRLNLLEEHVLHILCELNEEGLLAYHSGVGYYIPNDNKKLGRRSAEPNSEEAGQASESTRSSRSCHDRTGRS
ncbi:GntR family transcriptional regulator [Streptomyces sp. NPDC090994]|uniref:GntR family transcriptional regulator n=1 Tax=Streptomyces sp. NPDC090994 TaxID=3365969 RepID=UPI0037F2D986